MCVSLSVSVSVSVCLCLSLCLSVCLSLSLSVSVSVSLSLLLLALHHAYSLHVREGGIVGGQAVAQLIQLHLLESSVEGEEGW